MYIFNKILFIILNIQPNFIIKHVTINKSTFLSIHLHKIYTNTLFIKKTIIQFVATK